jgi:hypothetical protein
MVRGDPLGSARQRRGRGPVLHVGGDEGCDEHAAGVHQHVAFNAVYLFGPAEPTRAGHRGRLHPGGIHHRRGEPYAQAGACADLAADRGQYSSPDTGARPAQEVLVRC